MFVPEACSDSGCFSSSSVASSNASPSVVDPFHERNNPFSTSLTHFSHTEKAVSLSSTAISWIINFATPLPLIYDKHEKSTFSLILYDNAHILRCYTSFADLPIIHVRTLPERLFLNFIASKAHSHIMLLQRRRADKNSNMTFRNLTDNSLNHHFRFPLGPPYAWFVTCGSAHQPINWFANLAALSNNSQ